ncbi:Arabinosidase A [Tricladium varicosporioides]|nr:Arabinosidase A [Hymenoscyphus varicosporioides]
MAIASHLPILTVLIAAFQLWNPTSAVLLTVSTGSGQPLSPLLHGLMFEDISHSIDGGLHGQLLRNNGFQGDNSSTQFWAAYGNSQISQDFVNPLTSAIKSTLRISVPSGATGLTGVTNEGYLGITITPGLYTSSFFIKGDYNGDITIRLKGKTSGIQYACGTVTINSASSNFTQYSVDMWTSEAPDAENVWLLEFDASQIAGSSLNIGLPQLFPPTFKGRENGLNPKLANPLFELQPTFLRFPGGNNLEGGRVNSRWKWNETLGPVEDRPGRQGTWGYPNTDALGLMEYLYWCEDMFMTPVLAVWAGLAFEEDAVVGDALEPFINDALAEIEFVIGDTTTPGGAWRASLGHPTPFDLKFVEIGNEDNLGGVGHPGCPSYPERVSRFNKAIKERFPSITVIASTADKSCLPNPIPDGLWLDYHNYNIPENYVLGFTEFDSWDPAHPILIGEYARWGTPYPDMQGACSEAIYMMGWERNPQIVKMAAYAPTLQLVDTSGWQWTPNLISFTQNPGHVIKSTSWHVLKMFSTNKADTVLPVTSDSQPGPVYWSASRKGDDRYIIKLANYSDDLQVVYITIPGQTTGWYTAISAAADDQNTLANPNVAQPNSWTETATDGIFRVEVGRWGVAVLVAI